MRISCKNKKMLVFMYLILAQHGDSFQCPLEGYKFLHEKPFRKKDMAFGISIPAQHGDKFLHEKIFLEKTRIFFLSH